VSFVKVLPLAELPPGSTAEVSVGDDFYALCNKDGEIHALWGSCPCAGGPLGQGMLVDNLLVCPWHGRRYDVCTGRHHFDKDIGVPVFPVKIENGDILIDVTPSK
jgi:nitrite reductase/ring-hydroxylating ferredoxin subunit